MRRLLALLFAVTALAGAVAGSQAARDGAHSAKADCGLVDGRCLLK